MSPLSRHRTYFATPPFLLTAAEECLSDHKATAHGSVFPAGPIRRSLRHLWVQAVTT
jgi:hypothetical protein